MFLASRLPVPAGISPNGTPVPASPEQITRMVPSPPAPSTRSTPSRTACSVIARPGSSVVVSSQSGRCQPRARQLVLHVPAERHPVGHLGRVVDHRRPPAPARPDGLDGLAAHDLGHQLVRHRHLDPAAISDSGRHQGAEQRAADDVGDVVRAEDPAVDADREHQQPGARPASAAGCRRLCRVTANVAPTAMRAGDDAAHVAGRVGVAGRGHQVQRGVRPRPLEGDLDQLGHAPAEDDHQDQGDRRAAAAGAGTPRWRCPASAAYVIPGQVSRANAAAICATGDAGPAAGRRSARPGPGRSANGSQPGPPDQGHQQRGRDQDRGLGRAVGGP